MKLLEHDTLGLLGDARLLFNHAGLMINDASTRQAFLYHHLGPVLGYEVIAISGTEHIAGILAGGNVVSIGGYMLRPEETKAPEGMLEFNRIHAIESFLK